MHAQPTTRTPLPLTSALSDSLCLNLSLALSWLLSYNNR